MEKDNATEKGIYRTIIEALGSRVVGSECLLFERPGLTDIGVIPGICPGEPRVGT